MSTKSPFDDILGNISSEILHYSVRHLVKGKYQLDEDAKKLTSVVRDEGWNSTRFAHCSGLPTDIIDKVSAEGEDDLEQIESVFLAWAEYVEREKEGSATIEAALKMFYDSDENEILLRIVNELENTDTVERDVMPFQNISPQVSKTEAKFPIEGGGKKPITSELTKVEDYHTGKGSLMPQNQSVPAKGEPNIESSSQELESSFLVTAESEEDAITPVQESQLRPSLENHDNHPITNTLVTAPPSPGDRDHQIERMLSELEEMSKTMKDMENGLEDLQSEIMLEGQSTKRQSQQWENEIAMLEADNVSLSSTLSGLRKELEATRDNLQKAQREIEELKSKAARLEKDNALLRESKDKEIKYLRETSCEVEEENACLQKKNAELQEEVIRLKSLEQKYVRQIAELKEKVKVQKNSPANPDDMISPEIIGSSGQQSSDASETSSATNDED